MRKLLKFGCGGLIVLFILGAVLMALSGGDTTGQVSNTPKATPTPAPPAPPFDDIKAKAEAMTDAQRNNYLKGLVGYQVNGWTGQVCDVTESFGTYRVKVTLDRENDLITCTGEIGWKVDEEQALGYEKGQTVTVSGTIDSVSELMGAFSFELTEVSVTQ